jgi:ADP-ribosylation factor GTPase-activating protein 2/3
LGAKKTQKLGAKKLGGDALDFEAAEKKAKEEAERIAKLGYDPDAEDNTTETTITSSLDKPKIASPIPIAPAKASFGASRQPEHQRTPSELERLDMGMSRLGFGQVGGAKGGSVGTPRKMGFGSVGASKVAEDGKLRL